MADSSRRAWMAPVGIAVAILAVVAIAALGSFTLFRAERVELVLATGSPGGTYLPLGRGIAEVIEADHPEIEVRVVETRGAADNMTRLQGGQADLAFVQNDTTTAGARSGVRTIAPLYREVLHFLVRKDSGITTLHDIQGKRVSIGEMGSGTESLVKALLGHYALEQGEFDVRRLATAAAADALINGDIDAMLFVGGIKSDACARAVASGQVQFVGLGTPGIDAGEIEGFRFEYPFAEPYVIPVATYASPTGGKPEKPVATIAIRAVLVASSSMNEEVARKITASIFDGRTELIKVHGNAAEIRERFEDTWLQYPIHRGAQQYYRRDEPGFLVTYAELMAFILSLVVFLAATFAGIREWILRRKKNRIDVYYTRLDEILAELRDDEPDAERLDELEKELRDMHTQAFKALVAEQLRADESFRIFQDFHATCMMEIHETRKARGGGRVAESDEERQQPVAGTAASKGA